MAFSLQIHKSIYSRLSHSEMLIIEQPSSDNLIIFLNVYICIQDGKDLFHLCFIILIEKIN